jgi:hypothetical protein
MSYINKVFEHLKQLWMGIWQHTHTVTTTEVGAQGNGLGGTSYNQPLLAFIKNSFPLVQQSPCVFFYFN